MARKIVKWAQVRPGDIISFNYQSKKKKWMLEQVIVVLNPRLPVLLKDGSEMIQTIGLKIKEAQVLIVKGGILHTLFEALGNVQVVDKENFIYRVEINRTFIVNDIFGVNDRFYQKIKYFVRRYDIYRIYDWEKLRKLPLYLESLEFERITGRTVDVL